jgi:hypothetical protein
VDDLAEALGESCVSHVVNRSLVERQNATDQVRDAQKARQTYRFSDGWQVREVITDFTLYGDDSCW